MIGPRSWCCLWKICYDAFKWKTDRALEDHRSPGYNGRAGRSFETAGEASAA
jgi:hypothetical protein